MQGLHAQGQIGGVNYVTALASIFLPLGKGIEDYVIKGKTKQIGPFKYKAYNFPAMKADALQHFKEMGAEGGKAAAFVATLINGIVNSALTALKDAKFTTTLELRAAIFTAGFTGSFQIADALKLMQAAVAKKK